MSIDNGTIQALDPFITRSDCLFGLSFVLLFLLSLISVPAHLIEEQRIRPDGFRPRLASSE